MKLLTAIILLTTTTNLLSQTKSPHGFADSSIPELAQFEYYIGDWKAEMEMIQPDGSFKSIPTAMTISGKFLDDHLTYQSQFTTANGFFSTDIRTYNPKTKKWEALFLNAKAQRWHRFSASLKDGKMTTIVIGGYSGNEDFDVKTIDTVISDNQYLKHVYHSKDEMKTWTLMYRTTVTRLN
ncbi:MAG: hypothetical protein HEP71_29245 [Roseivirga sp.]|nr:hypothetical protein [Roseivirga sp.]